jgi:hypothetical protein
MNETLIPEKKALNAAEYYLAAAHAARMRGDWDAFEEETVKAQFQLALARTHQACREAIEALAS